MLVFMFVRGDGTPGRFGKDNDILLSQKHYDCVHMVVLCAWVWFGERLVRSEFDC